METETQQLVDCKTQLDAELSAARRKLAIHLVLAVAAMALIDLAIATWWEPNLFANRRIVDGMSLTELLVPLLNILCIVLWGGHSWRRYSSTIASDELLSLLAEVKFTDQKVLEEKKATLKELGSIYLFEVEDLIREERDRLLVGRLLMRDGAKALLAKDHS